MNLTSNYSFIWRKPNRMYGKATPITFYKEDRQQTREGIMGMNIIPSLLGEDANVVSYFNKFMQSNYFLDEEELDDFLPFRIVGVFTVVGCFTFISVGTVIDSISTGVSSSLCISRLNRSSNTV
jgi:hypothetical protein